MPIRRFLARLQQSVLNTELDNGDPVVLKTMVSTIQVPDQGEDEATLFEKASDLAAELVLALDSQNFQSNIVSSTCVKELEFLGMATAAQ